MLLANPSPPPLCVFIRSGDYDALHEAFAVVAAAIALDRKVEVFASWWALERLVKGKLDEPDMVRHDVAAVMESRGHPSVRALIAHARATGNVSIFACSGSMSALGLTTQEVAPAVDSVLGWSAILARTQRSTERFFF